MKTKVTYQFTPWTSADSTSIQQLITTLQHDSMIKNYLVIALRNFLKNKAYTLINILGLSLGLTCLHHHLFGD